MSEHKHRMNTELTRLSGLDRRDTRAAMEQPHMVEHLGYEVPRWLAQNDADPPFPQPQHTTSQMYIHGQAVDVPRSWRRGRR